MKFTNLAPTLIVNKIEPTLDFFVNRLDFKKVVDVPGKNKSLIFALLKKDAIEIHLQTKLSAKRDIPYLKTATTPPASFLYIDVEDVKTLYSKFKKSEIIVPLEKTFYGATHFFIKEPGGHVIGFSQNGM